jgi:hypothetical protein
MFEYPFMKNEQVEIRSTKLIQRNEMFPSRKSIKFTEKQIPKEAVLDIKFLYNNEELSFLKNTLLSNKYFLLRKLPSYYSTSQRRTIYSCNGVLPRSKQSFQP